MTLNDFMALAIVVVAFAIVIVDILLALRYPEQRWIRIPRGIAAACIGTVFGMNLCKIWVDANGTSVPPLVGRSAVLLMVATILAGAIYSLRSKGTTL